MSKIFWLKTLHSEAGNFILAYYKLFTIISKTFNIYIENFLYQNSHIADQNLSTRMLQSSKLEILKYSLAFKL